jgi:hypothetical protein
MNTININITVRIDSDTMITDITDTYKTYIHMYRRYLHTYVHPPVSGPCLAQSCQPCLSQLLGIPVVAGRMA